MDRASGKTEDIIDEYEEIRDELVSCIYGVWDHLKNGGDHGAENYDLEWVGMLPGVRESRRLVGDYILNENDVLSNRVFEGCCSIRRLGDGYPYSRRSI